MAPLQYRIEAVQVPSATNKTVPRHEYRTIQQVGTGRHWFLHLRQSYN